MRIYYNMVQSAVIMLHREVWDGEGVPQFLSRVQSYLDPQRALQIQRVVTA